MNHFKDWFNYKDSLKAVVSPLRAGAALRVFFAVGTGAQAVGTGHSGTDGADSQRNPALLGVAYVIYAVVVAVILFALLYISRDFIAHQTGSPFLGAKPK